MFLEKIQPYSSITSPSYILTPDGLNNTVHMYVHVDRRISYTIWIQYDSIAAYDHSDKT